MLGDYIVEDGIVGLPIAVLRKFYSESTHWSEFICENVNSWLRDNFGSGTVIHEPDMLMGILQGFPGIEEYKQYQYLKFAVEHGQLTTLDSILLKNQWIEDVYFDGFSVDELRSDMSIISLKSFRIRVLDRIIELNPGYVISKINFD